MVRDYLSRLLGSYGGGSDFVVIQLVDFFFNSKTM